MQENLSKVCKEYAMRRLAELFPKVMGNEEPNAVDAATYFTYHAICRKEFGIGRDLSEHPRNPFKIIKSEKKDNPMVEWKRELNLKDVWGTVDITDIESVKALARIIRNRLSNVIAFGSCDDGEYLNRTKMSVVTHLGNFIDNPQATVQNFNQIMSELYNWGDIELDHFVTGKRCCKILIE